MTLVPAVSIRFWAIPGVSVSDDGFGITPAGRPVSDTLTLPVNPFKAFAVTETDFPALPAVRLRFVGAIVTEKSGAGAAALMVTATDAAWVRPPDVPVSVMVAVPALAVVPAVRVRLWAAPGASVSIDGLAVTPDGNPLTDRFTLPVNPFSALADTETDFPALPAVRLRLAGTTVSEKSGAGAAALTVSAIGAVWVRMPDVPVTVIGVISPAAEAAAVRIRFWGAPGVSVRLEGFAVTPDGKPVTDTLTLPVNPFSAFAVTATV